MAKPDKIHIRYEDFDSGRFTCIGRLSDGTQFMAFVTGAFPSGLEFYTGEDWRHNKQWLAIVHRFDAEGNHIESRSRLGGYDIEGREAAGDKAYGHLDDLLAGLFADARPTLCDIDVRMFEVEIEGVIHGLFYEVSDEEPEADEERSDWVMLQPHDIMFHPPWDEGEYST